MHSRFHELNRACNRLNRGENNIINSNMYLLHAYFKKCLGAFLLYVTSKCQNPLCLDAYE